MEVVLSSEYLKCVKIPHEGKANKGGELIFLGLVSRSKVELRNDSRTGPVAQVVGALCS